MNARLRILPDFDRNLVATGAGWKVFVAVFADQGGTGAVAGEAASYELLFLGELVADSFGGECYHGSRHKSSFDYLLDRE